MDLSPGCYIPRFSIEVFLIREKKIFKCFLPYMGMTAILFNDAEQFEQIDNMPLNLVKVGQVVSEKMFKDYEILYMYIAQRQGQITQKDKILIVTKRVCYFDHTL